MRYFLGLVCGCWLSLCLAATHTVNELKDLINQQQFQAAFELAQAHAFELEGDPEFDFLYGLSALQTGHFEPAIFSFERLSASFPNIQRYRLELARSYFYLGNLDQAEKEFQRILANKPPVAVQANIYRFLANIEAQRRAIQSQWHASLGLSWGYDDNFNSATSADQIEILLGPLRLTSQLSSEQRHRSSMFSQVRALASYSQPISRHTSWDAGFNLSHRLVHEDNDYNLSIAGLQAGIRQLYGRWQLRPGLSVNQYWLGAENYQQDASVSTDLYWQLKANMQPFMRMSLTASNNKINDDYDRLRPQADLGLAFKLNRLTGQASLNYASEQKQHQNKHNMRDSFGANINGQYRFNFGDVYASVIYQRNKHQDAAPVFNLTRDETFWQYVAGLRHNFKNNLSLYGQFSYLNNDSNINIYEYRRSLAETGVTLAF